VLLGKIKGEFMPRNTVNVAIVYCVIMVLLLSIIWIQMIFKQDAAHVHTNATGMLQINTIYEKCRWIFLTKELQLIMQTLAHISYKEQIACLKAYMKDEELSNLQLKTVILFKTAMLHKKNNKRVNMLNILSEYTNKKQLLLKIAASDCPEIIPVLYTWIKTHTEDFVQEQISGVYNYAIKYNNPLLFNCLLEYDIPLQQNQASAYLHTVLHEQKHKAFICLLVKAGAKIMAQTVVHNSINNSFLGLRDAKNAFYRGMFSEMCTDKNLLKSTYLLT
jgi:hypothetical protein